MRGSTNLLVEVREALENGLSVRSAGRMFSDRARRERRLAAFRCLLAEFDVEAADQAFTDYTRHIEREMAA